MTEKLEQPNKLLSEVHVYKAQSSNTYADFKAWLTGVDPRLGAYVQGNNLNIPLAAAKDVSISMVMAPGGKKGTLSLTITFP